jgi:ABC-type bacteriocin/lantibiotic exporter with double-glycine peptidase domain
VAGKPRLLLIDGALDAMPDEVLPGLVANIRALLPTSTIVIATGRGDVAADCDRIIVLPKPGAEQSPSADEALARRSASPASSVSSEEHALNGLRAS